MARRRPRAADGVVVDGAVDAGVLRLAGRAARAASPRRACARSGGGGTGGARPRRRRGHEPQTRSTASPPAPISSRSIAAWCSAAPGWPSGSTKRSSPRSAVHRPQREPRRRRPAAGSAGSGRADRPGMLRGARWRSPSPRRAWCSPTTSRSSASPHELPAINDRLLAFMAHDRVTLAGPCRDWRPLHRPSFRVRRGHWARSHPTSAFAGFASFFLFLGFGYFIRSTPSSPPSCSSSALACTAGSARRRAAAAGAREDRAGG